MRQTIATTVRNSRQGHMPTWERRLSQLDRRNSHSLCFRSERVKSISENMLVSLACANQGKALAVLWSGLLLMAIANWHLVYWQ